MLTNRTDRHPGLGPLIFRIAAWPLETTDGLRSVPFTSEVDEILGMEDSIRARSEELSALLHSEVPKLSRKDRATALRVRRALFAKTEPVDSGDLEAVAALSDFRDRLLTDDAERRHLRSRLECLRTRYDAALESELDALERIAVDGRFRKALAVASRTTSDAWEAICREGGRPERWRLRATLLNYVLRAAGRATPNGLWAGVALEAIHRGKEPFSISTAASKVFAKPDLNVLFEIFGAAASPDNYRRAVYVRLTSTLTAIGGGQYVYARCEGGTWAMAQFVDDGVIARLQLVLRDGEHAEFGELQAKTGLPEDVLHQLYVVGVLCAEFDRDGIYESVDAALTALIACLAPAEQAPWRLAIGELQTICVSLEESNDADVEGLRAAIVRAHRVVSALWSRYRAEPCPAERAVLVFDLTAPFEIGVSEDTRDQIVCALRRYWDFDRRGMGELLARSARSSEGSSRAMDVVLSLAGISLNKKSQPLEAPGDPENTAVPGSWEELVETIRQPELAQACRETLTAWTDELEDSSAEPVHRVMFAQTNASRPLGPCAALVVPGLTPHGLSFRIGSVAPDWGAFYGRFHHLFAASGKSGFSEWIARSRSFAEARGLAFADVAIRGTHDRNTALRPRLGGRILDPLSAQLTDVTAEFDPEHGIALCDQEGRTVFPVLQSAVETSNADPWSRWFADVESQAGRRSLQFPMPPLSRELTIWKHCPRLALDSSTVIAPERWWCTPETSDHLRQLDGFERYKAWRRWVRRAGIPSCIYAQFGSTETETLLLSDSVLCVEVLGRALSKTGARLRIQEMFFGEAGVWLRNTDGLRYMAEVAVAWPGDEAFWDRTAKTGP